jgi:DNA-binding LacI/PurR family transcriptional regulator
VETFAKSSDYGILESTARTEGRPVSRKTTIKDIAAKVGVGIGTVSRALNGNPNVKQSTRDAILRVANELNYIPNAAARMLVTNSQSETTIGLLVPVVENQFFFELIKWIHTELKASSFNIMIFNTDHGQEPVIHHIIEQRLGGVLILGDPPLSSEERDVLEIHRVPYLYIDHHEDYANFVTFDNKKGGKLAAQYLADKGCRKIVLVGLNDQSQQQIDRFYGFMEAVPAEGGIQVSELCIPNESKSYEMSRILLNDRKIDGIFYFSDTMAYGGIQAKLEMGSSVSIVGYDDIFPSKFMKLSTVRQSAQTLGRTAADGIVRLVRQSASDDGVAKIQTILTPELVDRQS